ncbi:MAG: hypothetical protein QXN55_00235 [Candidatus Nitrosotenuis sp.]
MNTFKQKWAHYVQNHRVTSTDMVFYHPSKALLFENPKEKAKVLLRSTFTPATNCNKLANGHHVYTALKYALYCISHQKVIKFCESKHFVD